MAAAKATNEAAKEAVKEAAKEAAEVIKKEFPTCTISYKS